MSNDKIAKINAQKDKIYYYSKSSDSIFDTIAQNNAFSYLDALSVKQIKKLMDKRGKPFSEVTIYNQLKDMVHLEAIHESFVKQEHKCGYSVFWIELEEPKHV